MLYKTHVVYSILFNNFDCVTNLPGTMLSNVKQVIPPIHIAELNNTVSIWSTSVLPEQQIISI